MAIPIYIPNNCGKVPFSPYLQHLLFVDFFDDGRSDWCEVIPHCITCVSLIISDDEHFMYLLALCMSSLEKCLFRSVHFFTWLLGVCYCYWVAWDICVFWKSSLLVTSFANILLQSIDCFFVLFKSWLLASSKSPGVTISYQTEITVFLVTYSQKWHPLNITVYIGCMHLVAQLCLPLCDPIDCSPSGFSALGDSPGKNSGVGYHALLQGIFPTQGSNPSLLHCKQILHHLSQWEAHSIG